MDLSHSTRNMLWLSLLSITTSATTLAEDITTGWTGFRNGGGSTIRGELPQQWAPDQNIAWQSETDGYGQSAPVILNDQIILTSVTGDQKETCAVTAYSLDHGQKLWQHRFQASHQGTSSYMIARAAPTPILDSQAVYAFFESGDIVALDLEGNPLWQRDLTADYGEFQNNHGLGSSPAQTRDLILLNIEHKGPSLLLALNKQTGKTAWKSERPSGSSWTSPIVVGEDGQQQVVGSSGGNLSGYNSENGKLLWSLEGLEGNSVPSPCALGNFIFAGARIPEFGSADEAAKSNLCIRITGDVSDPYELCWRAAKAVSDYASPVVDGEQVYFLNKVGVLYCVDAMSGESVYQQRLRTECWATPIIAESGIYFLGKDGTTRVVKRGREFEILASSQLWDPANPPASEQYREAAGGRHSHGEAEGDSVAKNQSAESGTDPVRKSAPTTSGGGRAGGMLARLMSGDRNGNGILEADELSADFQPMLKRVDTNGDGALDQAELKAMADSFAKRREGSQASARDPIVYGAAAVTGKLVIRTGTRLYCISAQDTRKAAGVAQ
jgi:hypothetical protein